MLLNRMQKNILTKPIISNFLKVILIYISLYTVYNKKKNEWLIDWLLKSFTAGQQLFCLLEILCTPIFPQNKQFCHFSTLWLLGSVRFVLEKKETLKAQISNKHQHWPLM